MHKHDNDGVSDFYCGLSESVNHERWKTTSTFRSIVTYLFIYSFPEHYLY